MPPGWSAAETSSSKMCEQWSPPIFQFLATQACSGSQAICWLGRGCKQETNVSPPPGGQETSSAELSFTTSKQQMAKERVLVSLEQGAPERVSILMSSTS